MVDLNAVQNLKEKISTLDQRKAEASGELKALHKELAKLECANMKEAKAAVKELSDTIEKLEAELEIMLDKIHDTLHVMSPSD